MKFGRKQRAKLAKLAPALPRWQPVIRKACAGNSAARKQIAFAIGLIARRYEHTEAATLHALYTQCQHRLFPTPNYDPARFWDSVEDAL